MNSSLTSELRLICSVQGASSAQTTEQSGEETELLLRAHISFLTRRRVNFTGRDLRFALNVSAARERIMRGQQEEKNPKSAAVGAPKEITVRPRKRKADVAIFLQDLDEDVDGMTKKKHRESEMSCSLDVDYKSPRSQTPTSQHDEGRRVSLTSVDLFHYNFHNIFVTPIHCTPLPMLCWASKDVVWNNMLEKDRTYTRDVHMLEKHPHLQPKMRAILLDWLMEVSEVYKLHRETYHLAQDYFDRFMATQRNLFKSALQLIGITCLFIAAKVEEMYPPKVHQFAYVTDEACTEDEILNMEIIIMKKVLLDQCFCILCVSLLCSLKPPVGRGRWPLTLSLVLVLLEVSSC
ncbi:G1/S-specific cyclin-E1 [Ataeniobius toweri]|uniref:G1/S-specific cyclin-E1 n=1 Tax=Ataeniobius toweri TaxID=208326 RepID=A0ABU7BYJ0_9TELE|nr:G1/S-specific cyclin-E1 [Ataeniobius toweri]